MSTGQSPIRPPGASPAVKIRRAVSQDVEPCGEICYEAFREVSTRHNFPPDFPDSSVAIGILTTLFSHPGFYCVVAEQNGEILGSNCLDERCSIAGIGPITIDPVVQNRTLGRQLMQAVLERAAERNFPGVRLVQSAFHARSLALYAKLGFVAREPLACMQGLALERQTPGYKVRAAKPEDLDACNALCRRVHGHDRGGELSDSIGQGSAVVAESRGRIVAYATGIAFFGHAVGETNEDLQALISVAPAFGGPGILVPVRNAELFRWCLANGLRVTQPMTLMTMGLYNEPAGAYLPSVLF
jgi:GNAT superfamily N-acetyltransferase